jgi:hypothetical protein
MSMNPERLRPVLTPAPIVTPAPGAPIVAPVPLPATGQPVGKLDPITLGVLATVKACSTKPKASKVATPELDTEPTRAELPRPLLIGAALTVLGGVAWLLAGSRGNGAPVPTTITRPVPAVPNIPLPAHVPARMSPLARSEFAGFVVVGGG